MQLLWTQCSREVRVASSSFDKKQLIFFANKCSQPCRNSFTNLSHDSPTVCAATPHPQRLPLSQVSLSPSEWASCCDWAQLQAPWSAGSPHPTGAGGREAAKGPAERALEPAPAHPSNLCKLRPYGRAAQQQRQHITCEGPVPDLRPGTTTAGSH